MAKYRVLKSDTLDACCWMLTRSKCTKGEKIINKDVEGWFKDKKLAVRVRDFLNDDLVTLVRVCKL